jgi:hypothetical protein
MWKPIPNLSLKWKHSVSQQYRHECERMLEHSPGEVQQLIADELRRMEHIRPQQIPSTAMLNLQDDQYEAYYRTTTAISHHNYDCTMLVPLRRTAQALNHLFLSRFCAVES